MKIHISSAGIYCGDCNNQLSLEQIRKGFCNKCAVEITRGQQAFLEEILTGSIAEFESA